MTTRRFEMRRSLSRPIEVISATWDEPVEFAMGDLSPRGAYVRSELLPSLGENVVCAFDFGPERRFDFFAEVIRLNMHRRRADRGWPGFGLRFLDAKPLDRLRIRDALRNLPPRPFVVRPHRNDGMIVGWHREGGLVGPGDYWFWDAAPPSPPRLPRIA